MTSDDEKRLAEIRAGLPMYTPKSDMRFIMRLLDEAHAALAESIENHEHFADLSKERLIANQKMLAALEAIDGIENTTWTDRIFVAKDIARDAIAAYADGEGLK